MKLEEAINRINKIDWKRVGKVTGKDEMYLGYEYLKRIAKFIDEQNLNRKRLKPLLINVAFEMGYCSDKKYIDYCELAALEVTGEGYPLMQVKDGGPWNGGCWLDNIKKKYNYNGRV